MSGELTATSRNWAERMSLKSLPVAENLPPERRRSWVYFKLWPNFAFDVYPDQVDIMQWLPISPTECLIREIGYARPGVTWTPTTKPEDPKDHHDRIDFVFFAGAAVTVKNCEVDEI